MTCDCDQHEFPSTPKIQPGASSLARQIGTFADFRTAMMGDIARMPAWHHWRGRDTRDFGVMLLEMWAYVCDVVSFYDQTIANEAYVRTAIRRSSLRRLTALIGYRPRPAVASSATVALVASGRRPITVPAGTAIRSSGFGTEPPQTFELDADTIIHPFFNAWPIERTRPSTVDLSASQLLVDRASCRVKKGDRLALTIGKGSDLRTVEAVERYRGADGEPYIKLVLDAAFGSGTVETSAIRILRAGGQFELSDPAWTAVDEVFTVKGKLPGIRPDIVVDSETIGVADSDHTKGVLGTIDKVKLGKPKVSATTTVDKPKDGADGAQTLTSSTQSNVKGPVTKVTVSDVKGSSLVFLHRLTEVARLTTELKTTLEPTDPMLLSGGVEKPYDDASSTTSFLLGDDQGNGVSVKGKLDYSTRSILPEQPIAKSLAAIVTAWGNVANVSRGESVPNEILGSGDPSVTSASFTLKKSPLTYFNEPSANQIGATSTLVVRVDGIAWREVPSFFGVGPDERVYIVREGDDGSSTITFGDGVRGALLPSGRDNIVAGYRFGAGSVSPPVGSITQLASAVTGLSTVVHPVPTTGGGDADAPSKLRSLAPRSALILGRAVSIEDMRAVALSQPGVIAATASWEWNKKTQRAGVHVSYIGDAAPDAVRAAIRGVSDPTVPISCRQAIAHPITLTIGVDVDPRYVPWKVAAAVHDALLRPDDGLFSLERIGIMQPLFESAIYAAVLAVEGTKSISGMTWGSGSATAPYVWFSGPNEYFDFRQGLAIDGTVSTDG
ncbi:putative baseplate assembly protein [soil metagenome]